MGDVGCNNRGNPVQTRGGQPTLEGSAADGVMFRICIWVSMVESRISASGSCSSSRSTLESDDGEGNWNKASFFTPCAKSDADPKLQQECVLENRCGVVALRWASSLAAVDMA